MQNSFLNLVFWLLNGQILSIEMYLDIDFLNCLKVYKITFNYMHFDRYLVQMGTNHCAKTDSCNGHEVNSGEFLKFFENLMLP